MKINNEVVEWRGVCSCLHRVNLQRLVQNIIYEPPHGKTNNLYKRKKKKTQISFEVTAKLISDFVFATGIVRFLYFLNPKFSASNHIL